MSENHSWHFPRGPLRLMRGALSLKRVRTAGRDAPWRSFEPCFHMILHVCFPPHIPLASFKSLRGEMNVSACENRRGLLAQDA